MAAKRAPDEIKLFKLQHRWQNVGRSESRNWRGEGGGNDCAGS
jgi:hypothetical protein